MSKPGDVFENPVTGERAIVRIGTEQTGGELLVADVHVQPGGAVMGEHYHPAIEERFTLLHGQLGVRLSGRVTNPKPGVMLVVPAGLAHDWWNAGEEDALVRVEIRPAARFEAMILNAFGLAQDGKVNRRGMPNLLQLSVFAREFGDVVQFTWPPQVVQRTLFGLIAPLAKLLGYRGSYPEVLDPRPLGLRPRRAVGGAGLADHPPIICRDVMNTEKLRVFAPHLNCIAPRSPYAALGQEFPVFGARVVDKCRVGLLGQSGSYHYNCPMDRQFFEAAGLEADAVSKGLKERKFRFVLYDHLCVDASDRYVEQPLDELAASSGVRPEQFASAESFRTCLSSLKSSISGGAGMMASASASCASTCTERSASSVAAIRI